MGKQIKIDSAAKTVILKAQRNLEKVKEARAISPQTSVSGYGSNKNSESN